MSNPPLNMVLLMADQWRWDTIFQPGHTCWTPNLNRFAESGIAFDSAFTNVPLCCPARGSLLTGLWPHQTGLMDNVQAGSFYPSGQLHADHKTYLERLRDGLGYAVHYAGKWHVGLGTAAERGIEADVCDGAVPGRRGEDIQNPKIEGEALPPFYASFPDGKNRDQHVIESGIANLEKLAQSDRPFCAIISTWGPHFPHTVPQHFADLYANATPDGFLPDNYCHPFSEENKPKMQSKPYWPCQNTLPLTSDDWRKTVAHYWGYCTYLDEQFGRVLDKLDELGIAGKTIVAFAVDHGEMLGGHGNFDKGPYFYEEIVHIPMIVRDPLKRQPINSNGFVNLRDLFPTMISLAGAEAILNEDERSRSYWRTDNKATFYTYDAYQGRQFKLRGISTARYKYNWSPNDLCELYDLENDPGERYNLVDDPAFAEVHNRLHLQLMAWMADEDDYLLHTRHLLPAGSYVDGRGFEQQHDPGVWSEAEKSWFKSGM
ncbi:MAG: sulfatase-like hydrolase/transferase [Anaerolineales bacterium]